MSTLTEYKVQPGDIIIKDIEVLRAIYERNYAPLLITIQLYIAKVYGIVITEAWRPKRHMNDVHGTSPSRANDDRFWCYTNDRMAYEIMHDINSKWEYDPSRPEMKCAIIHDSGKGIHFHIQVHPNTRRRTAWNI